MEVLKISAKTDPKKAAGALAEVIRKHGEAELQAIGAGAVKPGHKGNRYCKRFSSSKRLSTLFASQDLPM